MYNIDFKYVTKMSELCNIIFTKTKIESNYIV